MDTKYNVVGVIKSQICAAIVNSEDVRKALDFNGSNYKDYDPDDPFTLIHNCVIPWYQHPEIITTTEPLIFVGVSLVQHDPNSSLISTSVNILCSVDKDDMKTTSGYFRQDLLEIGCICYTRVDWIADEVIKAISSLQGTWIGDIELIKSGEYAMNSTRYCREMVLNLYDVNIGKLLQNG